MSVEEIIEEIKHLPSAEQARVARFVRGLDAGRAWTPEELSAAAERLAGETDSEKANRLKEEITTGFYGGRTSA